MILSNRDVKKIIAKTIKTEDRVFGQAYKVKIPNGYIEYVFHEPKYNVESGNDEIDLSGFIVSTKSGERKEEKFDGKLHKGKGMGSYRPLGNEIYMSFQDANEKLENIVPQADKVIKNIMERRMPFKTKKQKKFEEKEKQKEEKQEAKEKQREKKYEGKQTKKPKGTIEKNKKVEIDYETLYEENPGLFDTLHNEYPELEQFPYAIVYFIDDSKTKATIIFKNKKYLQDFPVKYLNSVKERYDSERKSDFDYSLEYYEEEKEDYKNTKDLKKFKESLNSIGKALLETIFKMKRHKGNIFDETDNEIMKIYNIKLEG